MSWRSAAGGVLAVILAALAVAACDSEVAPSPSPTPLPEATARLTRYDLSTQVWYAGFVLRFGSATAELTEHGGRVTVQVTVTNPGTDDRTLDVPVRIVIGNEAFEPTRESVLPTLSAGASGYTTLAFDVLGHASVDAAILRIGDPPAHLGIVPFTPGAGQAVTLDPITAKLAGTGNAADLRMTLRSGELRWDLPDWGAELHADRAVLTVTYDATYRGSFSGGFPFTGDNVALKLPDGRIVAPRQDGRSQSLAVIRAGQTVRALSTRFEIPSGVLGPFTLLVRNGSAQGSIRFQLPG